MNGPERDALERLARRLRREHFNRIHNHQKEHTMHEDHENMTRAELIEALKRAEIGQETYRRLLIDHIGFDVDRNTWNQPPASVSEPSPLARLAANPGLTVTVGGDIIEGPDGEPVAVTESFTGSPFGMYLTESHARSGGIDVENPPAGVTIVDDETCAVIRRGDDFEEQV